MHGAPTPVSGVIGEMTTQVPGAKPCFVAIKITEREGKRPDLILPDRRGVAGAWFVRCWNNQA
ncbi:MAG: hypothetical protein IPN81_12845 [Nitrosomonadales bacterium]|nr:hypothetical protein [Nitrosomonadales bacterium]